MIRGIRTISRPIEDEDQEFLVSLNSDPVVRANVVGWEFPQSLTEQRAWYHNQIRGNSHRWIVTDLRGKRLGMTGLWDIDWHNGNALTALKLGGDRDGNEVRGVGVGGDAIKAVMAFAFYDVGLHRLHTSIIKGNTPSERAYIQKCGWIVEGTSRRHIWRNGKWCDLIQLGVLRTEFDALPDAREYIDLICNHSNFPI